MEFSLEGTDGNKIAVTLHDQSDGWIKSELHIKSGAFSGFVNFFCERSDLSRFHEQLERVYETLSGLANFHTTEEQLSFVVKGDGRGHIIVTGVAIDEDRDGNELRFEFSTDQTFLKSTNLSLGRCLDALDASLTLERAKSTV